MASTRRVPEAFHFISGGMQCEMIKLLKIACLKNNDQLSKKKKNRENMGEYKREKESISSHCYPDGLRKNKI